MTKSSVAKPAGNACAQCPARSSRCVLPEPAVGKAQLVVIGESPSRSELEQGRPFSGGAGRLLMRGLATLGLRRGDVHWTNAVLCESREDELPLARKACAERLRQELAEAAAPIVIPVGAYGLQTAMSLSKRPQILRWRGSVSRAAFGATTSLVMPTVHPAYVMRTPKWAPVIERDVARVGRLMQAPHAWRPPEEESHRRIVVARDEATLKRELAKLGPVIGNDVETVGLGATDTALVCLALSDGVTTVVVPWARDRAGKEPWWPFPDRIASILSAALALRVSVTHNGPAFDHIVEARYGIRVGAWEDTLIAAHAVASHMPKGLAHVVTQYLDVPPWKEFEDRNADLERLWIYNARDTLYTILAWHALRKELEA